MFLGIDLGTSGIRVLLVDGDGKPVASAEAPTTVARPQQGWSEQDPSQWVDALETAIAELRLKAREFGTLKGIGVAGHMHGATLLDANDTVIRPCILWNDTRSHAEAARLDETEGVREISGNIVFPGFTAPKLEWVRKHEPENQARTAKVLLQAAYLNFYLTGDHVADMSDSAGTSWLDVGARKWSPRLLESGHMRPDQMPRLVEGSEPAGTLRREIAARWGVSPDVVVAGGAGDNAAAACGTGVLSEGMGFVSLGTSGVVLAARNGFRPDPDSAVHTFCHAIPQRWYQMGVMLSATDSLNWLSSITGQKPPALTGLLGESPRPPSHIRFLPYLSGERTPHNDADIRGSFTGLGTGTNVADMTQAVLEGVAYGLRDNAEALKATGARLDHMLCIGGGSASRYWVTLLATVLGFPLQRPRSGEFGAALGAARLGLCAATGAKPDDVMAPPDIGETILPVDSLASAFNDGYAAFRASYPKIREIQ